MRQRIRQPRDVVIDIAEDAIARMAAAHPVETASRLGRVAGALGKVVKIGASSEGAMALAGAGALYGIGKELVTEYEHHKQQREMKEKGFTEISAEGMVHHAGSASLPVSESADEPLTSSMKHTVSHHHQPVMSHESAPSLSSTFSDPYSKTSPSLSSGSSTSSTFSDPYSKAYASVVSSIASTPGMQSPHPLSFTPKTVQAAKLANITDPMRRAYIKVPRFKIPKDRPYDLVQWEANTQAIANNMMANASED